MNVESISDTLHFDQSQGLWRAEGTAPISYPADGNAVCFRIEDGSYWFSHRNRCIMAAVRRFPPEGFILDVGGGNGYVARGLLDAGYETVLLESGGAGARNARVGRRLPTVINATIEEAAFRDASVPNVGLFDVLEHIDDDRAFVEQLSRILRPGGLLYLTVPAFDWLWSISDVDAMHYRRFTRRTLWSVLAGRFSVLYSTYLFQRLVPMLLVARALPYRMGLARPRPQRAYEADHAAGRAGLSAAIQSVLESEVSLVAAGRSLRMGSSLLVVARRL